MKTFDFLAWSLIAAVVLPTSPVFGEWTYTNLHPPGVSGGSALFGVADGQQVGIADRDEDAAPRAAVWSGTAASWVDLNPFESISLGRGVSQNRQVGVVDNNAVIWSGTNASWISLHPGEWDASDATAIRGNCQAGWVSSWNGVSSVYHAAAWSDTAESFVDLHPAGAVGSIAFGVDGNQQVGQATVNDLGRASLWTGTAASWVDLTPDTPPGSAPIEVSVANAVHDGQQVGTVTYFAYGASIDHAGYWNGTAESWVDLNPDPTSFFTESRANAVFGGYQVGQADTQFNGDGSEHASFWHGTAESWVDLEQFLPANYIGSNAFGVWSDGQTIYVAGVAYNSTLNRPEAILWTNTVPEPATAIASLGLVFSALLHRRSRHQL